MGRTFVKLKLLTLLLLVATVAGAHAMFLRPQLEQVPIGRVLANLQQKLAQNPDDYETLYYLARVYSMAFATNAAVIPMDTRRGAPYFGDPGADQGLPVAKPAAAPRTAEALKHLTNAIQYYQRAAAAAAARANPARMVVMPIHTGLAWCIAESGDRPGAIAAYRRALQIAWHYEVDASLTLDPKPGLSWDKIHEPTMAPQRPDMAAHIGPGPCQSCEIISSLLNLLDPAKDAAEIAQLKNDEKMLARTPRAVTPIFVALQPNAQMQDLVDPTARVAFDLDGSGVQRRWQWITPKAAWLVYDHDGRGDITSGLQMFGAVTFWIFWGNGYDALASLDDNGDGVLAGSELDRLSLWQDANSNGISEPGEVRPVSAWNIVTIDTAHARHETGNPFNPAGVTLRDGTKRMTVDWIAPEANRR
jgi:tetratricopeptide (TPR) repeat protein